MNEHVPPALYKELRSELISAIASRKSYDVPEICVSLGLATGSDEEAFQSKRMYVSKRIAGLTGEQLLSCAKQFHLQEGGYALGETLARIVDLAMAKVTKLTRRRLIKLFGPDPFASEIDDIELISSIWPLKEMEAPYPDHYESLDDYLRRHTVWNDDLTTREVLEVLGLLECSQSQLFKFLAAVTSPEYQSPERQKLLSLEIDQLLSKDGPVAV